jgi:hypothetical protein
MLADLLLSRRIVPPELPACDFEQPWGQIQHQ